MKNAKSIYYVIFLLIFFSCGTKQEKNENTAAGVMMMEPPPIEETVKFTPPEVMSDDRAYKEKRGPDNTDTDKKKIIKDGSISIKVIDIEKGKTQADAMVKNANAYYEKEGFDNTGNTLSYNLKIRIPVGNFEKFITAIENGTGEITSKNIEARDVTEEFIDLESRLKNKKLYLNRYHQLLSKAASVKDILAIEENIRVLQEEIESSEGRLKYLNDQIAFSTLDLTLYQEKEYIYKPQKQDNFLERLKTSIHNGWTAVVDFFLWLIKSWPFLILLFVMLVLLKKYWKWKKQ